MVHPDLATVSRAVILVGGWQQTARVHERQPLIINVSRLSQKANVWSHEPRRLHDQSFFIFGCSATGPSRRNREPPINGSYQLIDRKYWTHPGGESRLGYRHRLLFRFDRVLKIEHPRRIPGADPEPEQEVLLSTISTPPRPTGAVSADTFLTAKEAAHIARLHPVTLLRWAREGRVPHRRLSSRKIVFPREQLNAWLESGYTVSTVRAA
jgi:excisionase family DNA binding protein